MYNKFYNQKRERKERGGRKNWNVINYMMERGDEFSREIFTSNVLGLSCIQPMFITVTNQPLNISRALWQVILFANPFSVCTSAIFFIFQKLIFRMYCDNWWPSESAQPPTAKITSWLINYTYSSVCEHPVKGWTNCLETIRLNNSFGPCTHAKFSSYKKPIHFCP